MAVIGNLYRQKAEQRNSPPWPSHYVRALDALLERGMGSGFLNGSFYQDGVYNFTREYNGRNVAWMAVERTENAATGEERFDFLYQLRSFPDYRVEKESDLDFEQLCRRMSDYLECGGFDERLPLLNQNPRFTNKPEMAQA